MKSLKSRIWLMRSILLALPLLLLADLVSQQSFSQHYPKHIQIAKGFVGTRELPNNRGYWIDRFNKFTKNPIGSPYCQAFVNFCIDSAKAKLPIKSGLAMNYKTKKSQSAAKVLAGIYKVKAGDVITWQKGKTIYGHTGFASENWKNESGMTIQANTTKTGESRDGGGIWEKKAKINQFSDFRIVRFTPVEY